MSLPAAQQQHWWVVRVCGPGEETLRCNRYHRRSRLGNITKWTCEVMSYLLGNLRQALNASRSWKYRGRFTVKGGDRLSCRHRLDSLPPLTASWRFLVNMFLQITVRSCWTNKQVDDIKWGRGGRGKTCPVTFFSAVSVPDCKSATNQKLMDHVG